MCFLFIPMAPVHKIQFITCIHDTIRLTLSYHSHYNDLIYWRAVMLGCIDGLNEPTLTLALRRPGWCGREHIDPWMAQYWRADGFQEVTLDNSDEHLTKSPARFPTEHISGTSRPLWKNTPRFISLWAVNIVHRSNLRSLESEQQQMLLEDHKQWGGQRELMEEDVTVLTTPAT